MYGIQINNLSKTFYNGTNALQGISINFKKNNITGLIGFNGSGKTTTFNILVNFIEDYEGKILFDGKTIEKINYREISYLASGIETKNITKVYSHFLNIAEIYGMKKQAAEKTIRKYAEFLDLSHLLGQTIKSLSNGNKQKVKLISCFLNPHLKYLFLDEPFSGIDPIAVKKVVNLILVLKSKMTILITSHRTELVDEICDEFFILKDGQIADSKVLDNENIIIEVNKEVDVEKIKNNDGILEIVKSDNYNLILIKNLSYFKIMNLQLVKDSNYIYSSLKRKDLTSSVFEAYK